MIYSNLLVFLAAIFLFSIASVPKAPSISLFYSLFIFAATLVSYGLLARRMFRKRSAVTSGGYFLTEKKLLALALLFYVVALFAGDLKYYISFLSIGGRFPAFVNFVGLSLFLAYLSIMWLAARKSYGLVFGRTYSRRVFIGSNIKSNLPIVLPWIALSLAYDLIGLMPLPGLKELADSGWGDVVFLGLFLVFVMLFFPPLVRRLWGCKELPDGALKEHLVSFCARQNFKAELYVWPLFEGRVLTAGVMGLIPGVRYILLTPAIMEAMTISELEAVMAHEIGHVKKKHLLLYVLLIGGFSLMAGAFAEPVFYFLLSLDWVFALMELEIVKPETLIGLIGGLPLLVVLLVYFRFIFGYFIRNFERQADLYVFKVLGTSRALISAFEKIVLTSGQRAETKNWHHFGIGERIAYLELSEREPEWIGRQDKKVRRSLIAYVLIAAAVIGLASRIPSEQLARNYEGKYIEKVLMQKLQGVEDKALWFRLRGDLLLSKKMEQEAMDAYNRALSFKTNDPELMNNVAWLLLTSTDPSLRNPQRALDLAIRAAQANPRPHVLDTLATAYWANGMVDEAVETERKALFGDPSGADFYKQQLERFRSQSYSNETTIIN